MSSNLPSPPSDFDSDSSDVASTPTNQSHLHRSLAHSWTSEVPSQSIPYYATSAASTPARSPPPILIGRTSSSQSNRGHRSTSMSSSHAGHYPRDVALSEEDEGMHSDDDGEEEDDHPNDTGHISPSLKRRGKAAAVDEGDAEDGEGAEEAEDDPITLKERQSLINVQHPFGLPIWKPALYKKSRSVTRYADQALHSTPSAQAERHLLPGNIFWTLAFGWWLALACVVVAAVLYVIPQGGRRYATLIYGLGWYLVWPFGKYVEGDVDSAESDADEEECHHEQYSSGTSEGNNTVRAASPEPPLTGHDGSSSRVTGVPLNSEEQSTITPETYTYPAPANHVIPVETTSLLHPNAPFKSYGTHPHPEYSVPSAEVKDADSDLLGRVCFWLATTFIIAPLMLTVCVICWALIVTIPMAKLNWALLEHIFRHPTSIRFCAAPAAVVVPSSTARSIHEGAEEPSEAFQTFKHPRLSPGQVAPSGSPKSTVLLCTYRAVGLQYFKYTVGGVNILFVNLLPVVFFVILDGMVLLKLAEKLKDEGKHVPAFLAAITSRGLIFVLSLLSVIPLSYFIGMAVASISAQSSIGMGAVINATFGSIIEILLYSIALTRGKGRLVEGSIVGSLLAGVLLMPGMSMCSSALRRKEQRFNAKSAGVTSMMLIMAIIGALTPTLFYQTYGNVRFSSML